MSIQATQELSHPTSAEPLVAGRATLDARAKAPIPFKAVRSMGGVSSRQISNARKRKGSANRKGECPREAGQSVNLEGCFQGYIKDEVRKK